MAEEALAVETTTPEAELDNAAPEKEVTATPESEVKEPEPEKVYTKAELDAEAAKIRNRYERKIEKQRMKAKIRAEVQQEIQPAKVDAEIKRENYKTDDEFFEAVLDHRVEQKLAQKERERAERESQEAIKREAETLAERAEEFERQGEAKYSDFDEVLQKSAHIKFSEAMQRAILESDHSADIAYYLGNNISELESIAKLSPIAQAKEIGKLEIKLSSKSPPKVTNAPAPVNPIGSGKSVEKSLSEMTMAEYEAYRKKTGARWAH